MTSPKLIIIISLFSLILPTFSNPITLELNPNTPKHSSQNPYVFISDIAKSTLHRAHHIKHRNKNPTVTPSTPLFAKSTGGYSVSLSLGTPPQKIPAFFDTGSSLVWVPCTSRYICSDCTKKNSTATTTTFKPYRSSSKKSIKCHNPKCQWLDQPDNTVSCLNCNRSLPGDCTKSCFYAETYGSGATNGNAIFENLNLGSSVVPGFFVGCSLLSENILEGIVGFGRSPQSLPNQLKLEKFSYCLVSHKYNDKPKSSKLTLGNSNEIIAGVSYTPLLKSPKIFPFDQYYYVQLEQISINDKIVNIPSKALITDKDGNGGTMVDSGSTLTALSSNIFDPVLNAFVAQMPVSLRKQLTLAKTSLGNIVCVNNVAVEGEEKTVFPKVVFHFKGGVKMDLSVDNYLVGGPGLLCLPFANVTFQAGSGAGPSVILGNYQQVNFHIEYDLVNERLGLKKQICS